MLVLAAAATVPLYMFTREVAIWHRGEKERAATYWFRQGQQQLRAGDSEAAIASFHRATLNDRDRFQYGLALATALAAGGHTEESRLALLRLRDSAPEHAEVNLQLARLAAQRNNLEEALHYYRNALYGVWSNGTAEEQRREARLELIHFLLDQQQPSIALSELLLLSVELPEDPASYTQAARLMMEADDPQQAFAHFLKAIQLDEKHGPALIGAGHAAFQMRDYVNASRYLQAAVRQEAASEQDRELLEITRLILAHDPFIPRLSQPERHRRLIANFNHALQRLEHCMEQGFENQEDARSSLEAIHAEALEIQPKIEPAALRQEPELLDAGMGLVYRMVETANRYCGNPTELDRALLRIGGRSEGGET